MTFFNILIHVRTSRETRVRSNRGCRILLKGFRERKVNIVIGTRVNCKIINDCWRWQLILEIHEIHVHV